MQTSRPIGVFDSGFGGLSVFRKIQERLPEYDYIYLGDNARAPYGEKSHQAVYEYTLQAVRHLFDRGCPIIILACNTASARALQRIQQEDLPFMGGEKRVLGIIRPSAEVIGEYTKTKVIGVLGTRGTVSSNAYKVETKKFFPDVTVYQHACPMWVSLVENNEHNSDHADYYIKKDVDTLLQMSADIDTIFLGCTHYPLLMDKIKKYVPENVQVVPQGKIVAASLENYLTRHSWLEEQITRNSTMHYYTTDDTDNFNAHASIFLGKEVAAELVRL